VNAEHPRGGPALAAARHLRPRESRGASLRYRAGASPGASELGMSFATHERRRARFSRHEFGRGVERAAAACSSVQAAALWILPTDRARPCSAVLRSFFSADRTTKQFWMPLGPSPLFLVPLFRAPELRPIVRCDPLYPSTLRFQDPLVQCDPLCSAAPWADAGFRTERAPDSSFLSCFGA